MKCGIVTVYNSENCGSFLQAYAMSRVLKREGYDVVFIRQNFGDHSASRRNYLKKKLKAILKAVIKNDFACVRQPQICRCMFKQAISEQLQIATTADKMDCYVLGSDIIWDITVPFFRNHMDFFWGTRFGNEKIISYAPSVGFAKEEDMKKCDFIREALGRMSAVSVRDVPSKELLQPYCDREIQIVCDPTYLLDKEAYDVVAKPTDLKNFLFIYCYGKLPSNYKEAIQAFAKEKNLKTVTFGGANPWCDINLAYDPLLFLSIYDKADYIITNTFHGTVFATIYEKRFAVIKNDKPKVLNVLQMCCLSDKMTDGPEDINAILNSNFDYDLTRQKILFEREKGLQYLKTAIEE